MKVHATPTKTPIDPQHPIDPQEWEIEYEEEDLQFLKEDPALTEFQTAVTLAVHRYTKPPLYFSDDGYDYTNSHAELWLASNQVGPNGDSLDEMLEWLNSGGSYNKWVWEDQPLTDPTKEMMVEVCKSTNPSVQWQALPASVKIDWLVRPSS